MPKKTPLTIAQTIERLTRIGTSLGMDTTVTRFEVDTLKYGKRQRWVDKVPTGPRMTLKSGSGICTADHRCTGTDHHIGGCPVLVAAYDAMPGALPLCA